MTKDKPIGIVSFGLYGRIEVVGIEYDIEDSVLYRYASESSKSRMCKARVRYDRNGLAYFKTRLGNIYMCDVYRVM